MTAVDLVFAQSPGGSLAHSPAVTLSWEKITEAG